MIEGGWKNDRCDEEQPFCAKLPECDWVILKRCLEEREGGAGENTRLPQPGQR